MKLQSKIKAFTIIELMITLSVAAILMAIAAPSFVNIINNNRLTTQINKLQAFLSTARSEAIKRGGSVTVCRSNNDQSGCGDNWSNGWLLFVDNDGDGAFEAGDEILRVHEALSGNNTLTNNNSNTRITYSANGLASGFGSTFSLCDERGTTSAKGLVISMTGRATTSDPITCS